LGSLRHKLPGSLADVLPTTIEDLREQLVALLGDHVQKISVVGMESFKIFGSVVNRRPGIMLSISSPVLSSYASNPL
ncbi:MAG: hypothetical protein WCR20_21660, partial [Verrucomicrobiota bacterium]